MQKRAGILMIVGSIIFIGGAFTLAPTGFFDSEDTAKQISAIEDHRLLWTLGFILIPIGGLTVASGISVLARNLSQISERTWFPLMSRISIICAMVGASTYVVIGAAAIVLPAKDFVENNNIGDVIFALYSLLTLSAVAMIGIMLFQTERRILGGFLVIVPIFALISGAYIVPLTNYVPLFIAGIVLAVRSNSQTKAMAPDVAT
jgi:hypothetical protein